MKIGVLLKQVPDTEINIKLTDDNQKIDETRLKWIVNPYDEYALEEALKIKDKINAEVIVVSLGLERVTGCIRAALAMGADWGIRIDLDESFLDQKTISKILSDVIKDQGFDIVFAGKKAIDNESSSVIQMISEILQINGIDSINSFDFNDAKPIVHRILASGIEQKIEVKLPAIFACEKGLNRPRYSTLPSIMRAKSKRVEVISPQASLDNIKVKYRLPKEKKQGRKIEGDADTLAATFVEYIKVELKII